MAVDPAEDEVNRYQYCYSNRLTYWELLGMWGTVTSTKQALLAGINIEPALFWRQRDSFEGKWWQDKESFNLAYEMLFIRICKKAVQYRLLMSR